jgi:small subunit ribosomal protein S1
MKTRISTKISNFKLLMGLLRRFTSCNNKNNCLLKSLLQFHFSTTLAKIKKLCKIYPMTKELLKEKNLLDIPKEGEIVSGKIVGKGRSSAFLDLGIFGTGIIYGREFLSAKHELKDLKEEDEVTVKIISLDSEEGYVECSRIQAKKEMAWDILEKQKKNEETLTVKIEGANKGGLLAKISGIPSFIPSSQLSPENYPRVEGGDSGKILKELQKFVGNEMSVQILDISKQKEKIILSEKANSDESKESSFKSYKEGDIVDGKVTGIVDFGAFVRLDDGIEGLVHISEIDWSLVQNPNDVLKEGEDIKAKIIKIEDGKIFLSLKALKKDPWKEIEKKHKEGDVIKGTASKFVAFGVFIEIEGGIQGLCHISEFKTREKAEETLKVGKTYDFKILSINAAERRLSLRVME